MADSFAKGGRDMSLQLNSLRVVAGTFALELNVELTGAVTGVFGSSGSGKTTLIETLAGLRKLQRGSILHEGLPLADTDAGVNLAPEKRRVGYVPQDGALFPHLDVAGNLAFGQIARRRTRATSAEDTVFSQAHVCSVLGIENLLSRSPVSLSGGERQRVALGRALVSAPKLLLLDEPLAALDVSRKETILPYLQRVRNEFLLPMVYVSHAPEEMVALCDDIIVLEGGRLRARGKPADVFAKTDEPRYRLL
jgi:molybdate transport system ATP-binding protein